MKKRLLHIIAQKPGNTGSGVFLQAVVSEARHLYEQAVLAGISHSEQNTRFFNDISLSFYPVCFETPELPFPVAGMSDVMPYISTRYHELTSEKYLLWKKAFSAMLEKVIHEFRPDVILSNHLWLLTALAVQSTNIPVVAAAHGTGLRQLVLAAHLKDEVIEGCRQVNHVLALNEHQKKEIVKNYGIRPNKVTVTGIGYREDLFYSPSEKPLPLKLVYAGKLSFSKGIFSLVRAFKNARLPDNSSLTIIGSGGTGEADAIKRESQKSPYKIKFTGALPQEKLAQIFRESHIFCLTSFYEGLPLVIAEALACQMAVLATDIPGISHWLGKKIMNSGDVTLVPLPVMYTVDTPHPDSLPEFEQNIASALEQISQRYLQTEPISFRLISDKSWTTVFKNIQNVFEEVMKDRKEITGETVKISSD